MARCVQYLDLHIAQIELLPVAQRLESKANLALVEFVQTIRRAQHFGQPAPARIVISMDVGVDHVRDLHAGLACLFDEPRLVAGHHVHGDGPGIRGTAKKIGQRGFLRCKLLEKHFFSLKNDDFVGFGGPVSQLCER